MTENLNWLENTYAKIGNQIEVKPLYWKHIGGCDAQLFFSLTNKGLSDQLSPVQVHMSVTNKITNTNSFEVHGMKKRGTQIEAVPVNACNMVNGYSLKKGQSLAVNVILNHFNSKNEQLQEQTFMFHPMVRDLHLTSLKQEKVSKDYYKYASASEKKMDPTKLLRDML